MERYKERFAEFSAESEALFIAEGLFLKDGRPTPFFYNSGRFNSASMVSTLGSFYADMLVGNGLSDKIDIIFGPSYKGSQIAEATAISLWQTHGVDTRIEYDRKEVKTHGESSGAESLLVNKTLFDGAKIYVVDDVWTSGATKYESIKKILSEAENQGINVTVVGMGIGVDRQQVGPVYDESKPKHLSNKERIILGARGEDSIASFTRDKKIPVNAVLGVREAIQYLHSSKISVLINGRMQPIDEKVFENFQEYMQTYGVRE
ncbi:MAG: phosphoribosyltransferase family protein [archaeon]